MKYENFNIGILLYSIEQSVERQFDFILIQKPGGVIW